MLSSNDIGVVAYREQGRELELIADYGMTARRFGLVRHVTGIKSIV